MKKEDGCRAHSQCYHVECFRCSVCKCKLTGSLFYEIEDDENGRQLFCEADYQYSGFRLGVEMCSFCEQPIVASENEDLFSVETLG